MAREYAKVYVSIWDDPDFLALTPAAQGLYFRLLTDATLTMCGVADWRPNRIAKSSAGSTTATVRKAAAELEGHRFIVTDDDTEEVLVRSFVRHDGILKSPNMVKAMVAAWRGTGSHKIKAAVSTEIRKGFDEVPEGFRKGSREVPDDIQNFEWNPSSNPSAEVPADLPPSSPILQPATSTQKKTAQRTSKTPDERQGGTAQALIGEWIDGLSKRPPGQVVGQIAKHVGAMVAEGIDADDIRAGLSAWQRKNLHPSTLPSVVHEVTNRPAPSAGLTNEALFGMLK